MIKKIAFIWISIVLFGTTLLAQTSNSAFKVTELHLDNGLTVMLSENHEESKVFGMILVKAGGKNDPEDATGIAHYLEHMLFKGTQTMGTVDFEKEKPFLDNINDLYEELGKTTDEVKRREIQLKINQESIKAGDYAIANELDKVLAEIGGEDVNAFTTEDMTAYHNAFPPSQIEKWLEIYSHRFEKPVFRLFQSELETVYEEKNRDLDSPFSQVFESFNKYFYKNHQYGQQTVLGSTEHLKNPPLKKMYEYYNTYYVPNNMALVISGDFDTEKIIPIIKEKFGDWQRKEVPPFVVKKEDDFNGREFVKTRLTPIKVGGVGFRGPKKGSEDELKMEIAMRILSNTEGTGYLDKLSDDGKIMECLANYSAYNDYGQILVGFIPKIIGQKLSKAEELTLNEVERLKKGEFSEEFFQAVKVNVKKEKELYSESNEDRVFWMIDAFSGGASWEEFSARHAMLDSYTKDDIVKVANKYFTNNCLVYYSKMGFPKKQKIDKPEFKPVIPKNEVKSEFWKSLDTIKTIDNEPKFMDLMNDVAIQNFGNLKTLNYVENTQNSIFSLELKLGVGKYKIPELPYAASYLNLLGTTDKTLSALKDEFQKLGATYRFFSREESFELSIEGLDNNLEPTLVLVNQLLNNLKNDETKIKKVLSDINTTKKVERNEPNAISYRLNDYVLYGDEASGRRELTKDQLKALTGKQLTDAFDKAKQYELTVNYVGKIDKEKVANLLGSILKINPTLPSEPYVVLKRKMPEKTTFYIIDRKKSVQSQINFNMECELRNNSNLHLANAFNAYFGDNMSGIVFQEIREFRSLAYSAYGRYNGAQKAGENNYYSGYIGCQSDKTNEAIEVMIDLIRNLPKKPERVESLRSSLVQTAKTSKPSFRDLIRYAEAYKRQGYSEDPNITYLERYPSLTFDDILAFHKKELADKPLVITIVGNAKRFDVEKLTSLGNVIMIKEKNLYVN